MFLWVRATFPRYRYDQIMRLGWKIFIPVTLVWLVVVGVVDAVPAATSGSKTMAATLASRHRFSLKDFLCSFMLLELFKGLALTGKLLLAAQDHRAVPGREDAAVAALPRPARAAPL